MPLPKRLDRLDKKITGWMGRNGIRLTRIALGIVFTWFGALKFLPGASPAEGLAGRTIERLTFGLVPLATGLLLLAAWEVLIGVGLLLGRFLRLTLLLLFLQMSGAMLPLLLFPEETFRVFPYAPTLEGQYIIKNVVLIAGAIVVGSTVRGGALPRAAPQRA
jgi:uncharacterized membrane protein YkgB